MIRRFALIAAVLAAPASAKAECPQPTEEILAETPGALNGFVVCLHNEQAQLMSAVAARTTTLTEIVNQHSAAFDQMSDQNEDLRATLLEVSGFLNDAVRQTQSLRRRIEVVEGRVDRLLKEQR